jgi:hypothetical protein
VDWTYDAAALSETRHYYGATLEVWLADKPLLSSSLGTLTGTLDHSACPPLPSPMTLQSGWSYAIDLTGDAGADTQLAAQLLLAALGIPAKVQLTLDVDNDDAQPLTSAGRTGHLLGSVTGTLSGVTCGEP